MDRLQYSLPWQTFVSLSSNDLNTALSADLCSILPHTGRPPAAPDLTAARIIREWFISADLHSSAMILLVVFLEEDGGQGWG